MDTYAVIILFHTDNDYHNDKIEDIVQMDISSPAWTDHHMVPTVMHNADDYAVEHIDHVNISGYWEAKDDDDIQGPVWEEEILPYALERAAEMNLTGWTISRFDYHRCLDGPDSLRLRAFSGLVDKEVQIS